jgi:hypothetical protein
LWSGDEIAGHDFGDGRVVVGVKLGITGSDDTNQLAAKRSGFCNMICQ